MTNESYEDKSYEDISCMEEWLERKGWSLDLPEEEQARIEADFLHEDGVVRAALWERHYKSLDSAERARLDAGTHPSDSCDYAEEAESYLKELQQKVGNPGYVENVWMSHYHGGTIVFTVVLSQDVPWREYRKSIPEFYRGFQVFVIGPRLAEES